MKMHEKRILLVALAMALSMLTGCERHSKSEQFFLIATNINLPYWQSAHEGFTRAAAEYGVTEEMRGPDNFTPAIEVDEFRAAVARKPAGILVSVADPKLMAPEIKEFPSSPSTPTLQTASACSSSEPITWRQAGSAVNAWRPN